MNKYIIHECDFTAFSFKKKEIQKSSLMVKTFFRNSWKDFSSSKHLESLYWQPKTQKFFEEVKVS